MWRVSRSRGVRVIINETSFIFRTLHAHWWSVDDVCYMCDERCAACAGQHSVHLMRITCDGGASFGRACVDIRQPYIIRASYPEAMCDLKRVNL